MMEENPDTKSEEKNAGSPATGNNRAKTGANAVNVAVSLLPLIVLLLGIAGAIYFYHAFENNQQQLSQLQQNTARQQSALARQITLLDENVARIAAEQDSLQRSLSELYQHQPNANEDWALAEVEYLLIIASHRLLLEQDANTALTAMEAAASRLQALENPDLIPVREQLTADINRLRAVNTVDTPGLALYLADLIERAAALPLRKPSALREESTSAQAADSGDNTSGWRRYLALAWAELKSLVVIKKSGEVRQALLLPDEEYFLTQNLRLELENARLAVMRRDTANLQASITLLLEWLNRYYETSDAAVRNVLGTLQQMQTLELRPGLPDISSSLETLRAYMRQQ